MHPFDRRGRVTKALVYVLTVSLLIAMFPWQAAEARGTAQSIMAMAVQPGMAAPLADRAGASSAGGANAFAVTPHEVLLASNITVQSATYTPDDELYSDQWGLTAMEAGQAWGIAQEALVGKTLAPVVAAVIDTGVDAGHPDLAGRLLSGRNVIAGAADPDNYADDSAGGHGTHVAGIIAATTGNGEGIAGAAGPFPVMVLPIKALGADTTGSAGDIADGIRYAADWEGADGERVSIINLSFGEYLPEAPAEIASAVAYARSQGIVIVAAAGNHDVPNPNEWAFYPAALPGVISVGALGTDLQPVSAQDMEADLMAPGQNILSTLPGDRYGEKNGTSAAAPYVTATAALIRLAAEDRMGLMDSGGQRDILESLLLEQRGQPWNMRQAIEQVAVNYPAPTWPADSKLEAVSGISGVKLTWTPAEQEMYSTILYMVFQVGNPAPRGYTIGATEFEVQGLNPGTDYTFKVEAVNLHQNMTTDGPTATVATKSPQQAELIAGNTETSTSTFTSPAVSDDGRYVAFASDGDYLSGGGDTNGFSDIYLYDREGDEMKLVSRPDASTLGDGGSYMPVVAGDGTYVLFASKASNLTSGGGTGSVGLILYDAATDSLEKVADRVGEEKSLLGGPSELTGAAYAMSANGRYIVYKAGAGSGRSIVWNVYLLDRWQDRTVQLTWNSPSVSSSTIPVGDRVDISRDGRYVVFATDESGLAPGNADGQWNVYVYDTLTKQTEWVSAAPEEEAFDTWSGYPSISADGRWVVFETGRDANDPGDTGTKVVYIRDRQSQRTEKIEVPFFGTFNVDHPYVSVSPRITADGRQVVIASPLASAGGGLAQPEVAVYDRDTGMTETISLNAAGARADGASAAQAISPNGRHLVYVTGATDAVLPAGSVHGGVFYRSLSVEAPGGGGEPQPPSWSGGAELQAVQTGGHYVALSWTQAQAADAGVQYYAVYANDRLLDVISGTATTYLMQRLPLGGNMLFRVEAGDEHYNFSTTGPELHAATAGSPETVVPGQVRDVAFVPELGRIQVNWADPADADLAVVRLYWKREGATLIHGPVDVPAGVQTAWVDGLLNDASYEFRFVTIDADGNEGSAFAAPAATKSGVYISRITSPPDGSVLSGGSDSADVSDDGRYVVYASDAANLTAGDTNGFSDIFLYDRVTEETRLISRGPGGAQADGQSLAPVISGDGRWIAFSSEASNLVVGDMNGVSDIFLYDRSLDGQSEFDAPGNTALTRISLSSGEPDGDSHAPAINADGSIVAFGSEAANLLAEDADTNGDIYVYDRPHGTLTLASVSTDGVKSDGFSGAPSISADGKRVVFESYASNWDDTGHSSDVYIRDLDAGTTRLLSAIADDGPAKARAEHAVISGNGQLVVYSFMTGSGKWQLYYFDLSQDRLFPVEAKPDGLTGDPDRISPSVSADGSFIVYLTDISELVSSAGVGETGAGRNGVVVYDRAGETARVIGLSYRNEYGNGHTVDPIISGNGGWIVFQSAANNLVAGDRGATADIFLAAHAGQVDDIPPSWPASSALTADAIGKKGLTIHWGPAEDNNQVAMYRVEYGVDNDPDHDPVIRLINANEPRELPITGLSPGTAYTFRVYAADNVGNWSVEPLSLTVATEADAATESLDLQIYGDRYIKFNWEESAQADAYRVYRQVGDGLPELLQDEMFALYDSQYEADESRKQLNYSTTYKYWVNIVDTAGDEWAYASAEAFTYRDIDLASFQYQVDLPYAPYLPAIGQTIKFTAAADKNLAASVEVSYDSWLDEGGHEVAQPVSLTKQIPLTERIGLGLSYYEGQFVVPSGAARITAIAGKVDDGRGHERTQALDAVISSANSADYYKLPLSVEGQLQLSLETSQPGLAAGNYVYVSSESARYNAGKTLTGSEFSLGRFPAADDYAVKVTGPRGTVLLQETGISIRSGMKTERVLQLPVEASIQLKIVIPNSSPYLKEYEAEVREQDADGLLLATQTISLNTLRQMEGEQIYFHVKPRDTALQASTKIVTLQPGANEVEIALEPKPLGVITGVVYGADGLPAAGESVEATMLNGTVIRRAKSGAGGSYTLQAPEGEYSIYGGQSFSALPSVFPSETHRITVEAGAAASVDLVLRKPATGVVKVYLHTKYPHFDWGEPQLIDRIAALHYHPSVRAIKPDAQAEAFGGHRGDGSVQVVRLPGDPVEVCLDFREIGFGYAGRLECGRVDWADDTTGEADVWLEDKSSQLQAELYDTEGLWQDNWTASLYEVGDQHQIVREIEPGSAYLRGKGSQINLTIPAPGRYAVRLKNGGWMSDDVEFQVLQPGETVRLGKITMRENRYFRENLGNGVFVQGEGFAPGEQFTVRVAYVSARQSGLQQGKLKLEIPVGAALVSDSVTLEGNPIGYSESPGWIELDLSNPHKGNVSYKLQMDESRNQVFVGIAAKIRYEADGVQQEELIGRKLIQPATVTLEAPQEINDLNVRLYGKAPAGSQVNIYLGDALLGQVMTAPTSIWKLETELPDIGASATYALKAQVNLGGSIIASPVASVRYTDNVIQSFTISGTGGSKTFNPGQGIAVFPIMYYPRSTLSFEVKFAKPDKVTNVHIHMQGKEASAVQGEDGKFLASIPTNSTGDLGRVSVSYDAVPEDSVYQEPTEEAKAQRRAAIEEMLAEQHLSTEWELAPGGSDISSEGTLIFRDEAGEADSRVEVSVQRDSDYTPSDQEVELADRMGVPIYGLAYELAEEDGSLVISYSAWLPEELLADAGALPMRAFMLAANTQEQDAGRAIRMRGASWGSFVKVGFKYIAGKAKTIEILKDVWDFHRFTSGIADLDDTWGGYIQLLNRVTSICDIDAARKYQKKLDHLVHAAAEREVFKNTVSLVTGVGSLFTGLTASIPLGALDYAVSWMMDTDTSNWADQIKKQVDNDPGCKNDPDDSISSSAKAHKQDVADPVWILDPSGYAYEVNPDERLEGVTATALYKDEASGAWLVWDSGWFEQVNPQQTGSDGRYGWDVPPGLWKIMVEKDGYETNYSDELPVPPPHFDVNIPMVSLLPPQVVSLRALPGGAGVEIAFDKYVKLDSLAWYGIAVEGVADGLPVAGAVSASPQYSYTLSDPDHTAVTKVARFVAAEPLIGEERYKVTAAQTIASYAGTPMGSDWTGEFTAVLQDLVPPGEVTGASVIPGMHDMLATWADPRDIDFAEVRVYVGEPGAAASDPHPVVVPKGTRQAVVEGLSSGTDYELLIRTADEAGNLSAGVSLRIGTAAEPDRSAGPDTIPPDAVTDARIAESGSHSIKLQWNDPEEEDLGGIELSWKEANAESFVKSARVSGGAGVYSIAGLQADTSYKVRLIAVDAAGNRSSSIILSAETKPADNQTGNGGNGGNGGIGGGTGGNGNDAGGEVSDLEELVLNPAGGEYTLFAGDLKITAQQGGFAEDTTARVSRTPGIGTLPPGYTLLSPLYEWQVDPAAAAQQSVRMGIAFDPQAAPDIDWRQAGIYRQDDAHPGQWIYVGGIAQSKEPRVQAAIAANGTYAVLVYAKSFADLFNHWGRNPIELLVSRHVVSGVDDVRFEPDRNITRAEMATLLVRYMMQERAPGLDEGQGPESAAFRDVKQDAWYASYVNRAAQLGLIAGYDGLFRPNDPITREEMAVMVYRAASGVQADTAASDALASFADADRVSDWALEAIRQLVQRGWIHGMGDNTLLPQGMSTRAQAAVLLVNLLGLGQEQP